MSKRARADSPAASAGPAAGDAAAGGGDEALTHHRCLAGWCEDKLREVGNHFAGFYETTAGSGPSPPGECPQFVDERFDDFLSELHYEQQIVIDEVSKGHVAKAWREAATDAVRVCELIDMFTAESRFRHTFFDAAARETACNLLSENCETAADEWIFNLGYSLAEVILRLGGDEPSSEDDESDEPVEESDSEDEEEEDDASSSGSGSESESEEK